MLSDKITRINELAHKAKTDESLTPQEIEEQRQLRAEYIAEWKQGVIQTLENTYIVDESGKHKLQKKK